MKLEGSQTTDEVPPVPPPPPPAPSGKHEEQTFLVHPGHHQRTRHASCEAPPPESGVKTLCRLPDLNQGAVETRLLSSAGNRLPQVHKLLLHESGDGSEKRSLTDHTLPALPSPCCSLTHTLRTCRVQNNKKKKDISLQHLQHKSEFRHIT